MYCYSNRLSPYIWYEVRAFVLTSAYTRRQKTLQLFLYKSRPSAVALSQYSHNSSKKDPTKSQTKIKMKFLVVFALCIVAALAAPAEDVQILKNDFENIGVDGYKFAYVDFEDSCKVKWKINQKWNKIVLNLSRKFPKV